MPKECDTIIAMRKNTKHILRILGIILVLLPFINSIMHYDVASGENELLTTLAAPETSTYVRESSAANLDITGFAGTLNMTPAPVIKRAYLTFDDGPSINTDRILNVLALYGVKATFFVNNKAGEANVLRYQRIVNEGHTIGLHSTNHVYKQIYRDDAAFVNDYLSNQAYVAAVTGVTPVIYRFPGGSNNSVSPRDTANYINILNQNGIAYYDWNVSIGDAVNPPRSREQLIANVLNNLAGKNDVMILMHDLPEKTTTVDALPAIIEGLIQNGYMILPIDTSVPSTTPVFHFK